jgi:hypothetical protein
VEGSDVYGHTISRQTGGDPDAVLAECVEFARTYNHDQKAQNGS